LYAIKKWTIEHKYPFYFATEASVNLTDHDDLLQLMQDVDFRYVFLGIETPENESLILSHKNQNLNKPVTEITRKIMSYGIVCNGGFIIGFDSDSPNISDNMIACIQDSGICMAMVGQLYALPNTQLTQRLESEGRLFRNKSKSLEEDDIDQSTTGLNFITKVPRVVIMKNFVKVMEHIYEPRNYYKRVIYNGIHLMPSYKYKPSFRTWLLYMRSFLKVCKIAGFSNHTGFLYWKMFFIILFHNPKAIEAAVNLATMYIHFRTQKEFVVSHINALIQNTERVGEANV
jgi:radical SAM superfamily enzyme YgiQ (UPF0313 family)